VHMQEHSLICSQVYHSLKKGVLADSFQSFINIC
jgi:hypothetical protein